MKIELRGRVEEVKDRKGKGGFKVSLGGETASLKQWVGVRMSLYLQTEEETKEFPIGKAVHITFDTALPEPPKPPCPHTKWRWEGLGGHTKVCVACGDDI